MLTIGSIPTHLFMDRIHSVQHDKESIMHTALAYRYINNF